MNLNPIKNAAMDVPPPLGRRVLDALARIGRPALATDIAAEARISTSCVTEYLDIYVHQGRVTVHRVTIGTWRAVFYEDTP